MKLRYFSDLHLEFIKPNKKFRKAEEAEGKALTMLLNFLKSETNAETKAEEIQNKVYQIGKDLGFDLKNWFSAIYQILLGSNEGPRVGSFIKLYGIENTIKLISEKLA